MYFSLLQTEASDQSKSFASLFGKDPEKVKVDKLDKLKDQIRDVRIIQPFF